MMMALVCWKEIEGKEKEKNTMITIKVFFSFFAEMKLFCVRLCVFLKSPSFQKKWLRLLLLLLFRHLKISQQLTPIARDRCSCKKVGAHRDMLLLLKVCSCSLTLQAHGVSVGGLLSCYGCFYDLVRHQ